MSRSSLSLRSLPVVPSLTVLGLLAGCGRTPTTPVSLTDLTTRSLTYALVDIDSLQNPDAADSHRFTVTLSQAEDGCTRLVDGVIATFNGQLMKLEPGGISDSGGSETCEETRAWLDFDPAVWDSEPIEDARIFFQAPDGSRSLSLILQSAKAKRHFTFQGSGTGATLRQGQKYTYRWEPVDETPDTMNATLLREGGQAAATLQISQEGGDLNFTLPKATPVANHLLTLSGSLSGVVLDCSGVVGCQGSISHSTDFKVAVAP